MITLFEKFESLEFKKYFIADLLNNLAIFEIVDIERKSAMIKILYIYVDDNNGVRTFKGGQGAYNKPLDTIRKNLFMSDDLQMCIDIIPILSDENKYNL